MRVPGVDEAANDAFLDQMEAYFGRPDAEKMRDVRPQLAYQVRGSSGGRGRGVLEPAVAGLALTMPVL